MPSILNKIKNASNFLGRTDGTLKSKVIRSGFWVTGSSIGLNILTVLRSIIIARLLSPEIIGLMGLCLIIITGMELFSQTGFGAALIYRKDGYEDAKNTAFSLLVIRGFLLFIITFLIAPLAADYYERNILNVIIKVIGIGFIFKGFDNINIFSYEKELNFQRITIYEQLKAVLDFTVIVTLVYIYRNIWGLVIGHLISSIFGTIFSYVIFRGKLSFRFDKSIALELFNYGKFITGLTIVLYIASEFDKILIGKLLGMENLGYYVIAFMLANIPATHISKIVSRVMFPAYSKLQNDYKRLRIIYYSVLKFLSSLAVPAAFGIAVLSTEIITILYGSRWLPAADPLKFLCIFGGLRSIASLNGYLCNGIGKPQIPFYFGIIRLAILSIGLYPTIKYYGLNGAALLVSFPFMIEVILGFLLFKSIFELELFVVIRIVFISLFTSTLMSIVILYTKHYLIIDDFFNLICIILIGVFAFSLFNLKYILGYIHKTA